MWDHGPKLSGNQVQKENAVFKEQKKGALGPL